MIEVGKKYLIKTKIKKSVTQIEFFENSSGKTILYDTVYRSGEFMVMPGDEDEVKYLQKFVELNEDSFEKFDLRIVGLITGQGWIHLLSPGIDASCHVDCQDSMLSKQLNGFRRTHP